MKLTYYYGYEAGQFSFYRIPELLYGIFPDRMSLPFWGAG